MYPTKKLWEICKFQNWFAFKSELFKSEWLPILRISNIQDNNISYEKLVFFDKNDYEKDLSNYIVSKWDLVIAMSWATTWKLAINNTNDDFYLNQRVWKFIFDNDITKRYTHFLLSTKIQENLNQSVWSAIPNLSTEQIKNLEIPLPPLPIQKLIVQKLDSSFEKIDQSIELTRKNLQNIEELNKSVLEKIFSEGEYEVKKMNDICEKITDGTHQTPTYFSDGVIFLSSKNVTSWFIDWKNIKYIDEKQHIEMSKRITPKKWDILLAKNWTTWVWAIVDRNEIFDIYVSLALLRPKEFIISKFLLYFINSPIAKRQFNSRLKWVWVPNLHLKEIKEVGVPIFDIKKQKEIVAYLDDIFAKNKALKESYEKKLKDLEEMKQTLLKEAFEGRLVKE